MAMLSIEQRYRRRVEEERRLEIRNAALRAQRKAEGLRWWENAGDYPIKYLHEGSRADMYTNVTPSGSLALSEEAIVHFSQGQHSQRGGHMRDILTVRDVAELICLKPQTVRDLQDRGELGKEMPGSSHRKIPIDAFLEYIARPERGYTQERQAEITRQMKVRLRDVRVG